MPRVRVDDAELHVEVRGAGPPLVLLHGFAGSAQTWAPHLEAFSGRYTVVALDLLGHGESAAPPDPKRYAIAHAIEDTLGVLDVLGLGRVHLLGYSMGGRAALAAAIAAPERVRSLVLESASPGLRDPDLRRVRAAQDAALADAIERDGVLAFVERWEREPLFATHAALPPDVREALRAQRLRHTAAGLANSLRGFGQGAMPPLHDFLGEVRMPALLIAGALDARYTGIAREMAAALPAARLEVVPGAGHTVHLEQPEAFRRLVLEFLDLVDQITS